MPFEIKMPALSPTMEEGTLAKWLVAEGDTVKPGDIIAEIETDKATMEFEAIDEGRITSLVVAEGSDGVRVGTVIALLEAADTAHESAPASTRVDTTDTALSDPGVDAARAPKVQTVATVRQEQPDASRSRLDTDRSKASPLARRIAAEKGMDLSALKGSGPNGRIVKADVDPPRPPVAEHQPSSGTMSVAAPSPVPATIPDIPHELRKLSNMRKTIARRLTEAKQQVPHIYLTVDVQLDALLALRADMNAGLASRGVKLSVNDFTIRALALALVQVPRCNVMFTPDQLVSFARADISVAVSTPEGLITPVITQADTASLSSISTRMKDLASRARDRKLKPEEFAGGTASLSNLGMYGIKQFEAVINPPQAMIMAVGAGERRPWIVEGDALGVAQVMSATGSFDHRAIDGADGAALMQAFRELVEAPFGLL